MVEFWNKPSQIKLHSISTLLRFSGTTVPVIRAYFRMLLPQLDGQKLPTPLKTGHYSESISSHNWKYTNVTSHFFITFTYPDAIKDAVQLVFQRIVAYILKA
jgi:hypothetical protein